MTVYEVFLLLIENTHIKTRALIRVFSKTSLFNMVIVNFIFQYGYFFLQLYVGYVN